MIYSILSVKCWEITLELSIVNDTLFFFLTMLRVIYLWLTIILVLLRYEANIVISFELTVAIDLVFFSLSFKLTNDIGFMPLL